MKFLPDFNFFSDVFDEMLTDPFLTKKNTSAMKTDVTEKDGNFLLDMELPGYSKDDIQIELKNGTLNVSAVKNVSKDERDDQGKVIRRERYTGSCTRSFYVGKDIKEDDIKAKFENGELKIVVPADTNKEVEDKKLIAIE